MLASLFSPQTVCAIRGGESGCKNNRLCSATTTAFLTAANDKWSHFRFWCADQGGNAEWTTDLRGADGKV